jgi:photosystem II stability/assembly factor-like uncharacterized protein
MSTSDQTAPSVGASGAVVTRGLRVRPVLWLGAAAILFVFFSYLAFRREPWPGAFGVPLSGYWWSTLAGGLPTGLPAYNVQFNGVSSLPGTDSFVAVGSGGGIARSVDGGKIWDFHIWTGRSTDNLWGVSFSDGKVGWAVGNGGIIYKTLEGGKAKTWDRLSAPTGFHNDLYAVKAISSTHAVAVGVNGAILLTDDGGHTWTLPGTPTGFNLFGVDFGTEKDGVAVGNHATILRTKDGGASWEEIETEFAMDLKAVCFSGSRTVWAAGDNEG